MSRYSPYFQRLQRLEPEPEYIEPWPPDVEGSLSKVLYDQMIAEGVELPAERPGKDIAMCLRNSMHQEYGGIMSKLVALERRILILEKSRPEPAPWPPKPETMSYHFYQDLGQPNKRMGFMEMYLLAAEQFYEAGCN